MKSYICSIRRVYFLSTAEVIPTEKQQMLNTKTVTRKMRMSVKSNWRKLMKCSRDDLQNIFDALHYLQTDDDQISVRTWHATVKKFAYCA